MLTFEEKKTIIESFKQLTPKAVSLGRINYHYLDSDVGKTVVVYHLHPNGNGFVYAGQAEGYETDDRGLVNIRDYSSKELKRILQDAIDSMSPRPIQELAVTTGAEQEERWVSADQKQSLMLILEDDLWMVYVGLNLESAFETYEEAVDYLQEEGFTRV